MAGGGRLGVIRFCSFCPIFEPQTRNNRHYLKSASTSYQNRGSVPGGFEEGAVSVMRLTENALAIISKT